MGYAGISSKSLLSPVYCANKSGNHIFTCVIIGFNVRSDVFSAIRARFLQARSPVFAVVGDLRVVRGLPRAYIRISNLHGTNHILLRLAQKAALILDK